MCQHCGFSMFKTVKTWKYPTTLEIRSRETAECRCSREHTLRRYANSSVIRWGEHFAVSLPVQMFTSFRSVSQNKVHFCHWRLCISFWKVQKYPLSGTWLFNVFLVSQTLSFDLVSQIGCWTLPKWIESRYITGVSWIWYLSWPVVAFFHLF